MEKGSEDRQKKEVFILALKGVCGCIPLQVRLPRCLSHVDYSNAVLKMAGLNQVTFLPFGSESRIRPRPRCQCCLDC